MSVKAFSSAGFTPAATRVVEMLAFSAVKLPDVALTLSTLACVNRIIAEPSVAMPGTKRDLTMRMSHHYLASALTGSKPAANDGHVPNTLTVADGGSVAALRCAGKCGQP